MSSEEGSQFSHVVEVDALDLDFGSQDGSLYSMKSHGSHGISGSPRNRRLMVSRSSLMAKAVDHDEAAANAKNDITLIPPYQMFAALEILRTRKLFVRGIVQLLTIVFLTLFVLTYRTPTITSQIAYTLADAFLDEEFVLQTAPQQNPPSANNTALFKKTFRDIMTIEEFWIWAFGPLYNGIFDACQTTGNASTLYDGTSQIYFMGGAQGGILMRTSRVVTSNCVNPMWNRGDCYGYIKQGQATDYYGPASPSSPALESAFTFNPDLPVTIGTAIGNGVVGSAHYGPGAYGVEFPVVNCAANYDLLYEMYQNNWLDESTRIVEVMFNTFNPATSVMSVARFYVEFAPSGYVRPKYELFNAVLFNSHTMVVPTVFGSFFFVSLIVDTYTYMVRSVHVSTRQLISVKYIFRTSILALMWASSALVFVSITRSKTDIYDTLSSDSYFDIIKPTRELQIFDVLVSVNLVIATIRFLNFLPFRITKIIMKAMNSALYEVGTLSLVIIVLWFAFSIGAHVTFGPLGLGGFMLMDYTVGSLMVLMFSGDVAYADIQAVAPQVAPIFYIAYMIFMWAVMLNIFVAIIIYSYECVKRLRKEYNEWSEKNRDVVGDTLMVMSMTLYMRYLYYRFEMFILRCISSSPNPGPSLRARSSFFMSQSAKRREEQYREFQMACVIDKSAMEESKRMVMRIEDLELRQATAKRVGFPYRTEFRKVSKKVIHQIRVRKMRQYINELISRDNPTNYLKVWRKEFEKSFLVAENSKSLSQWFHLAHEYFKRMWKRSPREAQNGEEISDQKSRSIGNASFNPTASTEDMKKMLRTRRNRRFKQKVQLRIARLERELEVMELQLELERMFKETQILFAKHKMKFRHVVKHTWDKSQDRDKLCKLSRVELREVMSTICLDVNLDCMYCKDGKEIDERVDAFIATYQTLVLRQRALDRTKKTQKKLVRLVDLFKKEE